MIAEVIDRVVATFAPVLGLRRAFARDAIAQLATYAAADRGRGNKDWKASAASADLAIIPDSALLNARARQITRDTWIGKSAIRSWSRNVVGCGIMPVPIAKDANDNLLPKLNKRILKLFSKWAQNKDWCDVEKRQSFWQKQNLCMEELVGTGEHFIIWSYQQNPDSVGLRLQSAEPEQLDTTMLSFNGNEVRGGIEIDSNSAPVAYHFWSRNPADLRYGAHTKSIRITADRVFHVFKQERVQQTRGVTWLAPVLQDIRDYGRFKNATMWRAIMEACIGAIFKKENPTAPTGRPGMAGASGDSDTTASGMRKIDWVPGMVIENRPGESVDPFMPTTPGNSFDPFTKTVQRGIGAGVGISHGQVSRQSEGNYSAARQDMLEDRKEFEPIQELLAHNWVLKVYALFVRFAVIEGKIEIDDFFDDPSRYTEAEYVAPAAPWIDPEKEMNAYEKGIKLKIIDREEIIAVTTQKRRADVWDKIMEEQEEANERGIALPEVQEEATATVTAAVPILDKLRQKQIGPTVAEELLVSSGLARSVAKKMVKETEALPPPVVTTPDPTQIGDPSINAAGTPKKVEGQQQNQNGNGKNGKNGRSQQAKFAAPQGTLASRLAALEVPGYRKADGSSSCSSCANFLDGSCGKYSVGTDPGSVCDSFEAKPLAEMTTSNHVPASPRPDGEPGVDDRNGFQPAARLLAARPQPQPINVNVTVQPADLKQTIEVQPAPTPIVNIENRVDVQPSPAPNVTVPVTVEPAPAPNITVTPAMPTINLNPEIKIEVPPPIIQNSIDVRPVIRDDQPKTVEFERDAKGRIIGGKIKPK
jgi:lambda family phage portal protein